MKEQGAGAQVSVYVSAHMFVCFTQYSEYSEPPSQRDENELLNFIGDGTLHVSSRCAVTSHPSTLAWLSPQPSTLRSVILSTDLHLSQACRILVF